MNQFFKVAMFFTSFFPLWITILFVNIRSILKHSENTYTEKISIILIILGAVLSIIILLLSRDSIKQSDYHEYTILSADLEKGITSEYLLSYILPLFAFDFTVWDSAIQFAFYFLILSFLCVRNNNVYANILFEILGYKFFACEVKDLTELKSEEAEVIKMVIISKDSSLPSQKNNTIEVALLNRPFYLADINRC